jgi:hypothetical protein
MIRRTRVAAAALAFLLVLPPLAVADPPATHDTQAWLLLVAQLPIGEDWIAHAEVQPRWNDDISQKDQVILRGAVGRRLGPRVTAWAGYAYVPRWTADATLNEQRSWQQVNVGLPALERWTPSIRIRQEQRYLDAWGDTSHRFRALGRLVRPIGTSGWSAAVWDEWFLTLDDTVDGPAQGFDQNRLYLTALRKLSPALTFEGGYVWQHVPGMATRAARQGHTLFVWFNYAPAPR